MDVDVPSSVPWHAPVPAKDGQQVRLREVPADRAPIAVKHKVHIDNKRSVGAAVYRVFERRFWVHRPEFRPVGTWTPTGDKRVIEAQRALYHIRRGRQLHDINRNVGSDNDRVLISRGEKERLPEDTSRYEINQSLADQVIMVDGRPFVQSCGPIFGLRPDTGRRHWHIDWWSRQSPPHLTRGRMRMGGLWELEMVRQAATRLGQPLAAGEGFEPVVAGPMPELSYDFLGAGLCMVANDMLQSAAERPFEEASRAVARLYADIREVFDGVTKRFGGRYLRQHEIQFEPGAELAWPYRPVGNELSDLLREALAHPELDPGINRSQPCYSMLFARCEVAEELALQAEADTAALESALAA